jgi:hypothetical protein
VKWGKGKTFFHEKKSFSLPPHPYPFSKKARVLPLRCRGIIHTNSKEYKKSAAGTLPTADFFFWEKATLT